MWILQMKYKPLGYIFPKIQNVSLNVKITKMISMTMYLNITQKGQNLVNVSDNIIDEKKLTWEIREFSPLV